MSSRVKKIILIFPNGKAMANVTALQYFLNTQPSEMPNNFNSPIEECRVQRVEDDVLRDFIQLMIATDMF